MVVVVVVVVVDVTYSINLTVFRALLHLSSLQEHDHSPSEVRTHPSPSSCADPHCLAVLMAEPSEGEKANLTTQVTLSSC